MIPGMGAVATTFVAGVEAVRKGISAPIGSVTQMGHIRLGKRTDGRSPKVKDFVPLAGLNDLVFTGWDIFEDDMYAAAGKAGVLDRSLLEQVKPFLSIDQAAQGGVRQELREEARRSECEEGQEQEGTGRAGARGHSRVQEVERRRPAGDDLVRLDGDFHRSRAGASDGRLVREGPAGERREHRAVDDLRVCGHAGGRSVRQWRAEPDGGYSGDAGAVDARTKRRFAARITRRDRR